MTLRLRILSCNYLADAVLRRGRVRKSYVHLIRVLMICGSLCLCLFAAEAVPAHAEQHIILGSRSRVQWDRLLATAAGIDDRQQRSAYLSETFLGIPYQEHTLIGDAKLREKLVFDLSGIDCFTFLDYLESFLQAADISTAVIKLQHVRYRDGEVSYWQRNHFFSDWLQTDVPAVDDITEVIGGDAVISVVKHLNRRQDGSLWLAGLPVISRQISFLPAEKLTGDRLKLLRTGDYVGVYSSEAGLDVSHTGVILRTEDRVWLRHASSQANLRGVVDSDLLDYLEGKPGILIYRPQ